MRETVSSQRAFTTHKHRLWLMWFWLNWQSLRDEIPHFFFLLMDTVVKVKGGPGFYWKNNDNIFSVECSGGRISGWVQQSLSCKQGDSYWRSKLCLLGELWWGSGFRVRWHTKEVEASRSLTPLLTKGYSSGGGGGSGAQAMYGWTIIKVQISQRFIFPLWWLEMRWYESCPLLDYNKIHYHSIQVLKIATFSSVFLLVSLFFLVFIYSRQLSPSSACVLFLNPVHSMFSSPAAFWCFVAAHLRKRAIPCYKRRL